MADIPIEKQSKSSYLIISIIVILIFIAWALYLIHAQNYNTFPFTIFEPPSGDQWVYPKGVSSAPLTPEQLALVKQLLAEGIDDATKAIAYNKKK